MNAILKLLGIAFLAFVALAIHLHLQVPQMEQEALAYLQAKQPAIIGNWNEQAFQAEVPPELRESGRKEADLLFSTSSRLGKLKSSEPPKGKIVDASSTLAGKPWKATFYTRAQFEHGEATILTVVAKLEGRWRIVSMFVISPSFSNEVNAAAQRNFDRHFPGGYRSPLDAPAHR